MNWLFRRAQAYRAVFLKPDGSPNPPGAQVLAHLARFCRHNKPSASYDNTGRIDPFAMARMDGRREVFNLIQEHLHLPDRLLIELQNQNEEQDDGR
jgi:hypothetical protein